MTTTQKHTPEPTVFIRDLYTMNVGRETASDFIQRISNKARKEIKTLSEAAELYIDKYMPDAMMLSIDGMSLHEYQQAAIAKTEGK